MALLCKGDGKKDKKFKKDRKFKQYFEEYVDKIQLVQYCDIHDIRYRYYDKCAE